MDRSPKEKGPEASSFSPEEEAAIRRKLDGGPPPPCPRCGSPLELSRMPAPRQVSYVRQRVLAQCRPCRTRAVLDRK